MVTFGVSLIRNKLQLQCSGGVRPPCSCSFPLEGALPSPPLRAKGGGRVDDRDRNGLVRSGLREEKRRLTSGGVPGAGGTESGNLDEESEMGNQYGTKVLGRTRGVGNQGPTGVQKVHQGEVVQGFSGN